LAVIAFPVFGASADAIRAGAVSAAVVGTHLHLTGRSRVAVAAQALLRTVSRVVDAHSVAVTVSGAEPHGTLGSCLPRVTAADLSRAVHCLLAVSVVGAVAELSTRFELLVEALEMRDAGRTLLFFVLALGPLPQAVEWTPNLSAIFRCF
jgi:hypothetical protein